MAQDFTHLHLDLHFNPSQQSVSGTVNHRIEEVQPGDTLFLNGPDIDLHSLRWNQSVVPHRQVDSGLFIMPRSTQITAVNQLQIRYSAQPRKGLYFIGWQDPTGRARKQIWSQGQGIDHRHWIPHRDQQWDKIIYSAALHFDSAYQVISNGKLDSISAQGETRTWHYRMDRPMSSYLIAVAIGQYRYRESEGADRVPLRTYYYPDRAEDYPLYYAHNQRIYNFMLEEIGHPYPWSNYKQVPVRDFRHGAMENTTATIFGDFFLVDSLAYPDRNYTYVNAHELAHQWFGNLVTAENSFHHWLHEGFATYYQWRSEAMLYGQRHFAHDRYAAQEQILLAETQDTFPLAHPQAGSARFYQKGAWVLHMLRQKVGNKHFEEAVKDYLKRYAYQNVKTEDLIAVFEAVSGQDLKPFFAQWVFQPGVLGVVIKTTEQAGNYRLKLVNSSQKSAQLQIALHYQDTTQAADRLNLSLAPNSEIEQDLPQEKALRYWSCLNCGDLLGHFRFFKPLTFWLAQLEQKGPLSNQIRALEALASFPLRDTRMVLLRYMLDKNQHHRLRSGALAVLMDHSASKEESASWLDLALQSGSVELQKAAFQYWPEEPGGNLRNQARQLAFSGGSYNLRARALSASFSPLAKDQSWLYDSSFVRQPGRPAHQVHINALTFQVISSADRSALWQLGDYCSSSFGFLTRIKALEVIAAFGAVDEEHVPHVFDALFNPNWKLRSTARQTLQALAKGPAQRYVHAYRLKKEESWTDFQKRLVERTFEQVLD